MRSFRILIANILEDVETWHHAKMAVVLDGMPANDQVANALRIEALKKLKL